MKPFNLEEAKAGKPVCTRDGRDVRIICFDRADTMGYNIIALIKDKDKEKEVMYCYNNKGEYWDSKTDNNDLFMKSEKKEGWVNVYTNGTCRFMDKRIFYSKKYALLKVDEGIGLFLDTIKIEWEE